jgi:hypothetical protein
VGGEIIVVVHISCFSIVGSDTGAITFRIAGSHYLFAVETLSLIEWRGGKKDWTLVVAGDERKKKRG